MTFSPSSYHHLHSHAYIPNPRPLFLPLAVPGSHALSKMSSVSMVQLSILVSTFIGAQHDSISYFRCIYTLFLISSYCSGAVSSSMLLSNVRMMMMILHLCSEPYGPDAPRPYKQALCAS